jgi:transposase InsO family protein
LREATPFDRHPRFLLRDNDRKYGTEFARAARGIEVLRTPIRAPKTNAVCERFLGSVRREYLCHVLILNERHLYRILKEYVRYFNTARPHQSLDGQRLMPIDSPLIGNKITAFPVLNGLHHDYRRSA